MKRLMILLGGALVCAQAKPADPCPHWISVMPLAAEDAEGIAADAVAQGNETIIDGIAWIVRLCPEGNPVADLATQYAADYRLIEPSVRAHSGVKQGVLLQSTMGHGGFPGEATPWQLSVKEDGTSVYRMCPLDPRFLGYIAKSCRTLAALKPDFFMVDDDTRLHWNGILGCFCPLHLAALEKATGRHWTREEAAKLVKAGDADFLGVWEKVYFDSMAELFRTIRKNFDPETPGMLCTVNASAHFRHAKAFAEILAAPGQVPVVRGNGANYGGNDIYHCINTRASFARQLKAVGSGVVFLQEADTCPQQLWSCSATREYESMVLQALEGVKGAKIWITRTVMTRERRSQAAYRRILAANRGVLEWAAKADFRQTGVVVPNVGCGGHARGWPGWAERYLAFTGIPYRYGEAAPGEVTALCAETLTCLDRTEIEKILSGPVLLDGTGANWLAAHGFAELIGADARPWARKTVQRHLDENGVSLGGMRVDGELADLTALRPGAEILSRLYNVPSRGAEPVYEAPGSIAFTNARGGRVIALAQPLRSSMPAYYNHTLFSESYQAWIVRLAERLGGPLPVRFAGAGPVLCEAGRTTAEGDVFVLNPLDIDDLVEPEMAFARKPAFVERLMGDGVWKSVPFVAEPTGFIRLKDTVRAKNPTIYRMNFAGTVKRDLHHSFGAGDQELLEDLIRIPSVSADVTNVNRAVRFMRDRLASDGMMCRIETMDGGREVLFASNDGSVTPDVLFSAHLDVVEAQDPSQFVPRRENGRIYGRGASDCKEHCVLAVRLMRELKGKVSVGCIFGSDEEMGGSSTAFMLDRGYGAKKRVIVMDSEQYAITTRQKGLAYYRITKTHPPRHGGMVKGPLPNAAVELMKGYLDLAAEFPACEDGGWRDLVSLVGISGGASKAELRISLRAADFGSWERLEGLVREKIDGEIVCIRKGDPVRLDEKDPVLCEFRERMRAKWPDRNVDFYHLNSSTDARHLQRLGLPMLIIGVDARGAHSPDEHVILSSLDEYADLIKGYLVGDVKP